MGAKLSPIQAAFVVLFCASLASCSGDDEGGAGVSGSNAGNGGIDNPGGGTSGGGSGGSAGVDNPAGGQGGGSGSSGASGTGGAGGGNQCPDALVRTER